MPVLLNVPQIIIIKKNLFVQFSIYTYFTRYFVARPYKWNISSLEESKSQL